MFDTEHNVKSFKKDACLSTSLGENRLLSAFLAAGLAMPHESFEVVEFREEQSIGLEEANRYVFFPISAVLTTVLITSTGLSCGSGVIGSEGLFPAHQSLSNQPSLFQAEVQIPGIGIRFPATLFHAALELCSVAQSLAVSFAHAYLTQIEVLSRCNAVHTAEQRYVRWLLQTAEWSGRTEFEIRQEFIAGLLGLRRMSLTPVVRRLAEFNRVEFGRGRLRIVDMDALETHCCQCFKRIQDAYVNLPYKAVGPESRG